MGEQKYYEACLRKIADQLSIKSPHAIHSIIKTSEPYLIIILSIVQIVMDLGSFDCLSMIPN